VVTAASATDNQIGVDLLYKVVERTPTVTHAYVDAGFKDDLMSHGAVLGITGEQAKRSDNRPGFAPVAKGWVVKQTHGTLMLRCAPVISYGIVGIQAHQLAAGRDHAGVPGFGVCTIVVVPWGDGDLELGNPHVFVTQAQRLADPHPDIQQHSEEEPVAQMVTGVEDGLGLFNRKDFRARW
jgi:hypothetical protein